MSKRRLNEALAELHKAATQQGSFDSDARVHALARMAFDSGTVQAAVVLVLDVVRSAMHWDDQESDPDAG
jgi:hypothetical protein